MLLYVHFYTTITVHIHTYLHIFTFAEGMCLLKLWEYHESCRVSNGGIYATRCQTTKLKVKHCVCVFVLMAVLACSRLCQYHQRGTHVRKRNINWINCKSSLPTQRKIPKNRADKVDDTQWLTGNDRYFIPMFQVHRLSWNHPRGLKMGPSTAPGMTKAVVSWVWPLRGSVDLLGFIKIVN